jgi:LuxR family maltose regulon positive regulatory protein
MEKDRIVVKRLSSDAQDLRTRVAQLLRTDPASDDVLLMAEFLDQERALRLRDLLDSLALEGDPFQLDDLVAMVKTVSAEAPLRLTERERDVLQLLAIGMSNREIAVTLTVTVNTVKTHLTSLYSKLNVHSRVEAAVRARELRLL